jgi:acylphosphatase
MNAVQAKLIISGRVQGVFYRHSTREKARSLGISGWVKNRADGSVEIFALASKETIEQLAAWCKVGPTNARVEKVSVEWLRAEPGAGTAGGGAGDSAAEDSAAESSAPEDGEARPGQGFEIR